MMIRVFRSIASCLVFLLMSNPAYSMDVSVGKGWYVANLDRAFTSPVEKTQVKTFVKRSRLLADKFLNHLRNGETQQAYELMMPQFRESMSASDFAKTVTNLVKIPGKDWLHSYRNQSYEASVLGRSSWEKSTVFFLTESKEKDSGNISAKVVVKPCKIGQCIDLFVFQVWDAGLPDFLAEVDAVPNSNNTTQAKQ